MILITIFLLEPIIVIPICVRVFVFFSLENSGKIIYLAFLVCENKKK